MERTSWRATKVRREQQKMLIQEDEDEAEEERRVNLYDKELKAAKLNADMLQNKKYETLPAILLSPFTMFYFLCMLTR